jgi:hypothetical protein
MRYLKDFREPVRFPFYFGFLLIDVYFFGKIQMMNCDVFYILHFMRFRL